VVSIFHWSKMVPPTGLEPISCSYLELTTGISRAFYQLNYRGNITKSNNQNLERYKGLEPLPSAWKANMLAVKHQYRFMEQIEGIEPSLQRWQRRGLPLHHTCILVINIHDSQKMSSVLIYFYVNI
jgi:hypothetical protein